MKKTITVITAVVIFLLTNNAFKSNDDKFGTHLNRLLTNTNENNFVVWIYFKDKGPDAIGKLSNPLNLISERSFQRRLKVKSISEAVDITDAPLYEKYVNDISKKVLKVRNKSKWINALSVEVDRTQLNNVANLDFVNKIEIVERYKRNKNNIEFSQVNNETDNLSSDNPLVDSLNYGTGSSQSQITQIKVNQVHNEGIFGQGILIANFDAGFSNLTHEVFTTYPMKIISTYDFENHTPTLTGHSHGTATLSLVGGYKPGQLIGPAFESNFILARTEVDPTETPHEMDNWIAAVEWADSLGADVITSSLGYLDFDSPYPGYTWQDMNGNTMPVTIAADLAVNKGIVVSNSAGNNGSDIHNTLIGPADGDSVITVGAVTSTGSRASFSSVGPTTDIPSRIKPDVMAMGSNNYVAGTSNSSSYYNGSGTSFSCPLNSGVCALILSANKSLTPIQVRNILRKFASNSNTPNNQMGWGIIDAQKSVDSARKLDNMPPVIQYSQAFTYIYKSAPVKIRCRISDNGIIRNRTNESPRLYYRKNFNNIWTNFTHVNYYYSNLDSFYFSIPGSSVGTLVEYYIAAQDIALPSPLVSTLPAGGSGFNPPGSNPPSQRFLYKVANYPITNGNGSPENFQIYNYPNPFNPKTIISFQFAAGESMFSEVTLKIYDVLGNEVTILVNEKKNAGSYSVEWDASSYPSGIYFYKLTINNFVQTQKMLLLK